MVDVFLIIATLVAVFILLIAGVYLIIHYQHPDDKNEAWFPKLVVLFGFVLAGGTVLLVPLDVANNEGYVGCEGFDTSFCGGLDMEMFWEIIFWAIPLWIFVLIPFATFYYEADDGMLAPVTAGGPQPKRKSKLTQALCYLTFVLIIIGLVFVITYFVFSDTRIPVQEYVGPSILDAPGYRVNVVRNETDRSILDFNKQSLKNMDTADVQYMGSVVAQPDKDRIKLKVKAPTFYAGLMAWFGWFFFALFGGIGLAALPLDLLLGYVNRPRHLDSAEFAEIQLSLRERTNELVDIGELIKIERQERSDLGLQSKGLRGKLFDREKRKEAREERQAILAFKQSVYLLEKDVEDFQFCHANYEKYNPLTPYVSLVLGIASVIISAFWFLHICVYVLPEHPPSPFLNNFFTWFDGWFPLFGVLSVAIFTVYLLFAAVKGCFKFGLRFVCLTLHPMKIGKTYMSSMMFNIGLVLLCCLPVVQFASNAFADYTKYAHIKQIFGIQIEFLTFFSFFWVNNVFVFFFVIMFLLTCIYLVCKPKDTATSSVALRDRLRARRQS